MTQKPHLLKVPQPLDASFVLKGDAIAWDNPWHYHPEVELLFCIKGRGTNFVGSCIRGIEEGELLLFGKNLPHTRQRDRAYYQSTDETPETVVVQFLEEFLGKDFLAVPEFRSVGALLERARRGLRFFGEIRRRVAERLTGLAALDGPHRVLELLSMLDGLARSDEFEYLNPVGYVSTAHEKSSEKINRVYEYTINHFREPVALADVAALTHLSVSAFCRYFKLRTRKSYFQYLTEVRIGYACKLLTEGELDVGQVCYASGFNNLSHFHRQFRKVVGLTPGEYQQRSQAKSPLRV
jgi:AraC-like DNA-binding protein